MKNYQDTSVARVGCFLINDMVELGAAFFMSTKSKHIRFQLEIVETDMCRLSRVVCAKGFFVLTLVQGQSG